VGEAIQAIDYFVNYGMSLRQYLQNRQAATTSAGAFIEAGAVV
jgi:hypothetical protein